MPGIRLTAPEIAPEFAPETTNGKPLFTIITVPVLQPPRMLRANRLLSSRDLPLPKGDSYKMIATNLFGWSDRPYLLLLRSLVRSGLPMVPPLLTPCPSSMAVDV